MEYVSLMPVHTSAEPVMVPGVAGMVLGVIVPVVCAELVPHTFVAVTETVPAPLPAVIVAEVLVPPAVTAHPVPVTDQV